MDISRFKSTAKENLAGKWGMVIAALIIMAVAQGAASTLSTSVAKAAPFIGFFMSFLSVLVMPITIGYNRIHMDISEGKETELDRMFMGFRNGKYVNNFLTLFVMSVFLMFWTFVFIIPGIVKSFSYSMTSFILADPDYDGIEPLDAITKSREMMDGHKMDLFILVLTFIGWFILCMFTFGILLLYVAPYVQQTITEFYFEVKGGKTPPVQPKTIPSTDEEYYE